jgi:hypothetical protein
MSNYMDTAFGTPPWDTTEADKFEKEIETIKAEVKTWLGDLDQLGHDTLKCNMEYVDVIWDTVKKHTYDGDVRDAVFDDIMNEMKDLGW